MTGPTQRHLRKETWELRLYVTALDQLSSSLSMSGNDRSRSSCSSVNIRVDNKATFALPGSNGTNRSGRDGQPYPLEISPLLLGPLGQWGCPGSCGVRQGTPGGTVWLIARWLAETGLM